MNLKNAWNALWNQPEEKEETPQVEQSTSYSRGDYSNMMPVRSVNFDGEKTAYELGDVLNVFPNHSALRFRSYEAKLKSDIVKIITNKFFTWVIGSGLKLQAEPDTKVLTTEKIESGDLSNFQDVAEARFNLWSKSKRSDYLEEENLHKQANNMLDVIFHGGDSLIVLRIENGDLNVQVIDGQHVETPFLGNDDVKKAEAKGHTVSHGVERDKRGKKVAFYVRVEKPGELLNEYQRIPVFGEKTKMKMAWMVYWDKHRIDHVRGIGGLPQVLEKVDKLDRYTEATVGAAEELANLLYSIEHDRDSDGENPFQRSKLGNITNSETSSLDTYAEGETKAKYITATTSRQAVNMPKGATLKVPGSNAQKLEFEPFWRAVFNSIAAACDVPPEVALQMYNSNYSASRAAINAFEHIINVFRAKFTEEFYRPIYEVWLYLEVLKSKINAPGYLNAATSKNRFALEAYSNCRFTGAKMPHIDPAKEAKAIREILGDDFKHVPLANLEKVSEMLNLGSWHENYQKFKKEIKNLIPSKDGNEQNQNREQDNTVEE